MRNLKKQTKNTLISARIDPGLYESVKKYSEELDISISFLVDNALSFFMHCIENEDEDENIKLVLDEYYETDEDNEDLSEEDNTDPDPDEDTN